MKKKRGDRNHVRLHLRTKRVGSKLIRVAQKTSPYMGRSAWGQLTFLFRRKRDAIDFLRERLQERETKTILDKRCALHTHSCKSNAELSRSAVPITKAECGKGWKSLVIPPIRNMPIFRSGPLTLCVCASPLQFHDVSYFDVRFSK